MSQWGAEPPAAGQVQFFDPTKFQSGATNQQPANIPTQQPQTSTQQGDASQQNAWGSAWNSWDAGANPYAADVSGDAVSTKNQPVANNFQPQPQTNDSQGVIQQEQQNQWYGQNTWGQEQAQQNVTGAQNSTDPTSQYQWDPNTNQWVPNQQFNYGDYSGYNNYWQGQNGAYTDTGAGQNGFGNTGESAQVMSSANYYNQDQNYQFTNAQTNEASVVTTESTSVNKQDMGHVDLNASQSTTESSAGGHSIGNIEDGGTMGGFYNNEEYGDDDDDDEDESDEEEDDDEDTGSNINTNSGTGLGASHFENEQEYGPVVSESIEHIQSENSKENIVGQSDVANQMQALNIQDNVNQGYSSDQYGGFPNVPVYNQSQYQSNVPNVQEPVALQPVLNTGQPPIPFQPPSQESSQSWPPQVKSQSGEANDDNTSSQNTVNATPTFSDWEMVPHQEVNSTQGPTHSRNASVDNNVKFFISSANSSARVSPATSSKAGDEQSEQTNESSTKADVDNKVVKSEPVSTEALDKASAPQASLGLPPPGPPPMAAAGKKGGNPFRKSPNPEPSGSTTSTNDASMLSSTQLDVTRPGYENSPGMLGQSISSISPIMGNAGENLKNQQVVDSPDYRPKDKDGTQDTPNSKQPRKPAGNVKQSPIMPRKESPFQPPKHDQRIKPLKAIHDIPGLNQQDSNTEPELAGINPYDRNNRRTPDKEMDRNFDKRGNRERDEDRNESKNVRDAGRKTPDWDSRGDRRRGERERGRRTPDWDSRDKRGYDRRTPDRDTRTRGDRDRGYERSTRQRQSAFHNLQTSRSKNNVSPAASLLDIADTVPAMSNILLVPQGVDSSLPVTNVAPATGLNLRASSGSEPSELKPVANLITSLSEQIKTEDSDRRGDKKSVSKNANDDRDRDLLDKDRSRDKDYGDRSRYRDKGDRNDRDPRDRDRDRYRDGDKGDRSDIRGNRSYESLRDRNFKDSRNNSRERMSMYSSRNSLDGDDPRDRGRRGDSRDRSYRDDFYDKYRDRERDRPQSRGSVLETSSRRDYRDRDRDRDRDKDRDYYRRDRYDRDRPRSRQGGERDRPGSRQGDTDRDYRDKYRQTGYDYDEYYRRGGNSSYAYDRQYYDQYYYGHYGQAGYYDEHGYYHDTSRYSQYDYPPYQRRSRAGTPGSLSDGGQEIANLADKTQSAGRTDKPKRFDYPPDLYDYSQHGYHDSYYGYEQNGYRWDPDVSAWVETTTEVIPQRQTPEKFMIPHMRACFGPNGQLIKVLPNRPAEGQPATIEIHDVQSMLEESEESDKLNEYPGPLVKGDTHKNDVLLFCQTKARLCAESMQMEDRESAELIWKYLELLIKQNGTVVGTDIADLLLQGHEPTTLEYRKSGMKIAPSADALEFDDAASETSDTQRLSRGTTPVDRSMVNKGRSLEEVTDRFRHLLMFGRKKDALDWAMKNNLWGHALFLASKMDPRAHANVMTRFANVAMRMNDPLQTLYQLMSGRQPAAVTCVTEERWGDWRPHLAVILSNHTSKPDLDRKSITTLGDTLASRGFLHASHFCYLMSQTSFGSFQKKSSKIVLIGSSHGLQFEYFSNNEAIQCTEIYEYALALGNSMMVLTHFQLFKFLYATRLIDYGYAQDALHYCEVISRQINANPAYYPHVLVKLIYDLSSQLKFSDPSLEENEDEQDPEWLRALHATLVQFEEGAIQSVSGTVTPAYFGGRTTASSDSGEVGMYMQPGQEVGYVGNQGGYGGQQFTTQGYAEPANTQGAYMTAQGDYGGNQYSSETMATQGVGTQPHVEGAVEGNQYQAWQGENSYQTQQYNAEGQSQWQNQRSNHLSGGFEPTNQIAEGAESAQEVTSYGQADANAQYQHYDPNQQASAWSQPQQQTGFQPDVNLSESQNSGVTSQSTNKRSSLASTSSVHSHDHEATEPAGGDEVDSGATTGHIANPYSVGNTGANAGNPYAQQPSIFDLHQQPGKIIAPKLRPRTISESSAGSGPRDRHPSGSGNKGTSSGGNKDSLGQTKKQQKAAASGGGLFSKIGGFFSRKNEMILPDDKEPSIIWDPVKKRWVDKDADETEEAPAAPPPKDSDLSGPAPPAPAPIPTNHSPAPVATETQAPPPGGNKFSRRKGIGARSQYVDVMNPKSSSSSGNVPTALFSTLPNSKSAPAIFNPMGGPLDSDMTSHQEPIQEERNNNAETNHSNSAQTQPSNLHLPPLNENLSRNSSASSLSREVQRIMKTTPSATDSAPVQSEAPPPGSGGGMTMFNPAQFQPGQGFKQPAQPGPAGRLSNRRVYPK